MRISVVQCVNHGNDGEDDDDDEDGYGAKV